MSDERGAGREDDAPSPGAERRSAESSAATPEQGAPPYHVRPPKQERSRKTLRRIVAAARQIIAEEGVEAATVSRVVQRAGSSVGSFYARFEGKEDLLRYLEERVWTVARERWDEAMASRSWEDLELEGVVRSVTGMLVTLELEDADARRALEQDGAGAGEEAARFHAHVEADVRELLLGRRDRIGHPRPERAVSVAYRWAVGGIRQLLAPGGTDGGAELDADAVVEEATRGLLAYLGGQAASQAPPGDVEFFDVWQ